MSDIFVSYKRAQQTQARQLVSALAARGWDVWWDWNIPTGDDWKQALDRELDAAGCVLVLWTRESAQSEWVLYEARHAQAGGKLIQALLEPASAPAEFAVKQAVDLHDWQFGVPFHAGFDKLRAAVREVLDRRAPLATTRSDTLVRVAGEAGDVLRRDAAAPAVRARPVPVMLLPPPFRELLDRTPERTDIAAALAERRNISLSGDEGIGKSALLQYEGTVDHTERFHDGVAYLAAASQSPDDLAHALHEVFFDLPAGYHPSAVQMRRDLADKVALLMFDDADLPAAGLEALNVYAPNSSFVFSTREPSASARRRPVVLKGLPVDDGVALFERALSRPMSAAEREAAKRIVESLDGHPARIEQAAGTAAARGIEAAASAAAPAPDLRAQDAKSRRVLAALACGGAIALEAEQCAAIAQVDDVDPVLEALIARGLVRHAPPGFKLAAGLAPQVEALPEFLACNGRATGVYTDFAFQARGSPRSVARLAAPMIANMAWAAQHSRGVEALKLARALDAPLADANRWDAWRDMLERAYDIAMSIGDTSTAGWAAHQLGTRELLLGDKDAARKRLEEASKLRKQSGDDRGLAATRGNLKLLGWTRWMLLGLLFAGVGVTTLASMVLVPRFTAPAADVAPTSLDFGTQALRTAGAPKSIRIENRGARPLEVVDVTVEGANASAFSVGSSCNAMAIPPKFWCVFQAQFQPDGEGPRSANVTIRTRERDAPYRVAVQGNGTAAPIVEPPPVAVDMPAPIPPRIDVGLQMPPPEPPPPEKAPPKTVPPPPTKTTPPPDRPPPDKAPPSAPQPEILRFVATPTSLQGRGETQLCFATRNAEQVTIEPGGPQPSQPNSGCVSRALSASTTYTLSARSDGGTRQASVDVTVQIVETPPRTPPERPPDRPPPVVPPPVVPPPDRPPPPPPDRPPPPPVVPPAIVRFEAAPQALRGPGETRLCFAARNARQAFIEPGNAQPGSAEGGCVVRAVSGTTTFTLTVLGTNGLPVQRRVTVNVERPPEPSATIVRFVANPMRLKGSAQLCFAATNAVSATIEPGNPQPTSPNEGCVARQATVTTTYTLTVRGKSGPAQQRRVVVEVPKAPPPPSASEPPVVKKPDSAIKKEMVIPKSSSDTLILKKPDAVIRKEVEVPKSDAPRVN